MIKKLKASAEKNVKKGTILWKALSLGYKLCNKSIFLRKKLSLVRWNWIIELKLRNAFSKKIKVGFGPVVSRENNLSSRKWHIDPIVDYINRNSKKYSADIFFSKENLSRFDIIVYIKYVPSMDRETARQVARGNKALVYRLIDLSHDDAFSFVRSWAGKKGFWVVCCSPLQMEDLSKPEFVRKKLIFPSLINSRHKKSYKKGKKTRIVWQGYIHNIRFMKRLNPIIKRLAKEHDIIMTYHANMPSRSEGAIKHVKWKFSDWEKMLADSDIGVTIKPVEDRQQQRKPPTKVLSYMAAGLPVVCTPSAADKMVVEHGKTGFFAYTDEEWRKCLMMLIESPELREKIGKAARDYAKENFSIEKIGKEYLGFFDEIVMKNRIKN
jgi:glycosyltransferase involved in cell wall biosynthesis